MAGVNVRQLRSPEKTVLIYEDMPSPHKGKASVAFADGTVGQIDKREDAFWEPVFRNPQAD